MDIIEISGIFHDISLLTGYLLGTGIAIFTGRKNNINPSVTALLILLCTISYIFFSEKVFVQVEPWLLPLGSGFSHLNRTWGMAGAIFGLFLSGHLLNIPRRVLYSFSFPLMVTIIISNLGCVAGNCSGMAEGGLSLNGLLRLTTARIPAGFAELDLSPSVIARIISGFLALSIIYSIRKKIKNPRNLALGTLSMLLWLSFIDLFFTPSGSVFNRMIGLNVFQWAIILFNTLLTFWLLADESMNHRRFPKLKVKPPSRVRIFSIYFFIFFLAFPESSFLSKINLQIFIIGFTLTTIFLVHYFHTRLKPAVFRYAAVVLLLSVGSIFLQASIFVPLDRRSAPEKEEIKNLPEITPPGARPSFRQQFKNTGHFQVTGITSHFQSTGKPVFIPAENSGSLSGEADQSIPPVHH